MISRRYFLGAAGGGTLLTLGGGGYTFAEPWRLVATHYRVHPPAWPPGFRLRLAVLTDIHACKPFMSAARIRTIAAAVNGLSPDAVLLLGDFEPGAGISRWSEPEPAWAEALAELSAPLGVHAVLGNHDWWADPVAQRRKCSPVAAGRALEAAGITVYENQALRFTKNGVPFWIAGLGDQWAYWKKPRTAEEFRIPYAGVHDLPGTLAQVTDNAPVILMAHEPDIFPFVPPRVSLTLSGHTHGGQVRVLGFAPIVPSRYGRRYVYGHIVEDGRHLIVSSGLGLTGVPVRLGAPPEIALIDLGREEA